MSRPLLNCMLSAMASCGRCIRDASACPGLLVLSSDRRRAPVRKVAVDGVAYCFLDPF